MKSLLYLLLPFCLLYPLLNFAETFPNNSESSELACPEEENKGLRREIEEIMYEDQRYRLQMDSVMSNFGWESPEMQELIGRMHRTDSICISRMEVIIEKHGWPGISLVGKEANTGVWLVVQHADIATQEKYLPMLEESVKKGESQGRHLALLVDRTRLRNGLQQIYGSQIIRMKGEEAKMQPLFDPMACNDRRKSVGLESTVEENALRLEAKYDPAEDVATRIQYVDELLDKEGLRLYYRKLGKGDPLLVLHGRNGLNHQSMMDCFDQLGDSYQVIYLDLRASGKTTVPEEDLSWELLLEDLEDLRKELGIRSWSIAAHDVGGSLALKYASKFPEQVTKLFLSAPEIGRTLGAKIGRGNPTEVSHFSSEQSEKIKRLMATEQYGKGDLDTHEEIIRIRYSLDFVDPANVENLRIGLRDPALDRAQAWKEFSYKFGSLNLYREILECPVPLMIVYGSEDPRDVGKNSRVDKVFAKVQKEQIVGAGFFPFVEQEQAFLELIRNFLAQ